MLPVAGSRYIRCLLIGRKVEFHRSYSLFFASFESYNLKKFKFNDWLENNDELYGLSAAKVKLVDSLI